MGKLGELAVYLTADMGGWSGGIAKAQRDIASLARTAAISTAAAGASLAAFAAKAVSSYAESERASIALEATLAAKGESVAKYSSSLQEFAAQMQKTTIYEDDFIASQMATTMSLGVSADKIKDATKAAIGLTSMGMDLGSAMTLIGKASQGSFEALSRYGIVLDKSMTDQEKFNRVLEIGSGKFSIAQRQTQTLSGQWAQMKNSVGDLWESFGLGVSKITGASGALETARKSVQSFAETSANYFKNMSATTAGGWRAAAGAGGLAAAIGPGVMAGRKAFGGLSAANTGMQAMTAMSVKQYAIPQEVTTSWMNFQGVVDKAHASLVSAPTSAPSWISAETGNVNAYALQATGTIAAMKTAYAAAAKASAVASGVSSAGFIAQTRALSAMTGASMAAAAAQISLGAAMAGIKAAAVLAGPYAAVAAVAAVGAGLGYLIGKIEFVKNGLASLMEKADYFDFLGIGAEKKRAEELDKQLEEFKKKQQEGAYKNGFMPPSKEKIPEPESLSKEAVKTQEELQKKQIEFYYQSLDNAGKLNLLDQQRIDNQRVLDSIKGDSSSAEEERIKIEEEIFEILKKESNLKKEMADKSKEIDDSLAKAREDAFMDAATKEEKLELLRKKRNKFEDERIAAAGRGDQDAIKIASTGVVNTEREMNALKKDDKIAAGRNENRLSSAMERGSVEAYSAIAKSGSKTQDQIAGNTKSSAETLKEHTRYLVQIVDASGREIARV